MEVIQLALDKGQRALSEHQAKIFLSTYGVPVSLERLAHSPEEAAVAAEELGYPVALKACSPELMHKSEQGCIELNLKSAEEVRAGFTRITDSLEMELEGVLVQEMVSGQRELVMGLTRDQAFGPCVMLGLGGVLTEVLADTVFRVAPFDYAEAQDMTNQLRSAALLDSFRGQAPADREAICHTLQALGRIGLEHQEIAEIDLNPLIIDAQGNLKAVDALVVLRSENHAE
jgi:succinyl-CoA synthetase beta subunit